MLTNIATIMGLQPIIGTAIVLLLAVIIIAVYRGLKTKSREPRRMSLKIQLLTTLATMAALTVSYLLARFVFFGLHGMKEWPQDLFILGLVVIAVNMAGNRWRTAWCTVIGCLAGFVFGMSFNSRVPHGPETMDNGWIIWTAVYFACIIYGAIADTIYHSRRFSNYLT